MHDGNLFNDGQEKKVYVVSPITLMPVLNLIANTWKQMSLTSKANEGVEIAEKLRKRLERFDDLYHILGKAINNVITAYDKSVTSYKSRLSVALRDIKNLQGIEEDEQKDLKSINKKVKPLIEIGGSDDDLNEGN